MRFLLILWTFINILSVCSLASSLQYPQLEFNNCLVSAGYCVVWIRCRYCVDIVRNCRYWISTHCSWCPDLALGSWCLIRLLRHHLTMQSSNTRYDMWYVTVVSFIIFPYIKRFPCSTKFPNSISQNLILKITKLGIWLPSLGHTQSHSSPPTAFGSHQIISNKWSFISLSAF